jgi:hypothetical protein
MGNGLSQWVAAIVLVGYAVAFTVAALTTAVKRDIA